MILLTVNEWFGPSRIAQLGSNPIDSKIKTIGLGSYLKIGDALRKLRIYEEEFNLHFKNISCVEFSLVGVSEIDSLSEKELIAGRIELIEDMENNFNENK